MKIKSALEACLKRTGIELHTTELDSLSEIELFQLLCQLMEFAKNMEATQYYASSNQLLNAAKKEQ